jgi:hypothetical protein
MSSKVSYDPWEIVTEIRAAGGALVLNGSRIHYQIPQQAALLLDELRRHKPDVVHLLRRQSFANLLPFVGKRVWSPHGPGKLLVVEDCVIVGLEDGTRMRWYDSTAIIPYA